MHKRIRLLAGTLLFTAFAACSAPSDRNTGGSDGTIPATVKPTCTTSGGQETCTCKAGYELDGDVCRFVNLCEKTANGGCDANATCTALVGERTCKCKSGYTGDGVTCTATSSSCGTCDVNATCKTVDSGKACVCNMGYTGDGITCTTENPCAKDNGGCDMNAVCSVTIENAVVCTCKEGYMAEGRTCVKVNPCDTGNGGCDVNATCAVDESNAVVCTCMSGYTGDGHSCVIANPCDTNNGGCDVNAICAVDGASAAVCACKAGYTGDGHTCTKVNPCATNNGGCDVNATCAVAADDSVECACKSGYAGNGLTCTLLKGSVGETCPDSSALGQSTCQRGLSCLPLTSSNYCSKDCTTDADCGMTGVYSNLCIALDHKICLRGCDPSDRTTCLRADLACYPTDASGTAGSCRPACSSDNDCTYGDRCDTVSGVCSTIACNANGTCSSPSDTCYTRTENSQTVKSCVPKCTNAGCRAGTQCNTTTAACEPIVRDTYKTCGAQIGVCETDNLCVDFGDTGDLCLQKCTINSDCPSGSTCSVGLSDGQKICAVTCGTPQAPNDAACPSGTACAWFTDDTKTTLFCGPTP